VEVVVVVDDDDDVVVVVEEEEGEREAEGREAETEFAKDKTRGSNNRGRP